MNKNEFASATLKFYKKGDLNKKQVEDVLEAAFETIGKVIKRNKKFSYPGFGTFSIRSRKARKGRNPQTGDEMLIKPSRTLGFRPAPKVKKSLNGNGKIKL